MSSIGKIHYLDKFIMSNVICNTHQYAYFFSNQNIKHGNAIRWNGISLNATHKQGTILWPDKKLGLEMYVNPDYLGDITSLRHKYIILQYMHDSL